MEKINKYFKVAAKVVAALATSALVSGVLINLYRSIFRSFEEDAARRKHYQFTFMAEVATGEGPSLYPMGSLKVTNVYYRGDAVCFTVIQSGTKACLKLNMYDLKEINPKYPAYQE